MTAKEEIETVRVDLGARGYDILIGDGLIARAGAEIAARLSRSRAAIVTDENLARHHAPALAASLEAAGIASTTITVAPGEKSKSFSVLEEVVDAVLAARLERGDAVIALGGGVVGDLAGFVAGIVRRGMKFIQMPTSLLAQVDSSVGGKTGINSPRGKNRLCRGGQIRADRPAGLLRMAGGELARGVRGRAGARPCHCRILPRQGRGGGPRRVRDRRPGAAQSRPYLRPRA
jgi:hypothetical protein